MIRIQWLGKSMNTCNDLLNNKLACVIFLGYFSQVLFNFNITAAMNQCKPLKHLEQMTLKKSRTGNNP